MISEADVQRSHFASHLPPRCEGGVYSMTPPLTGEGLGTSYNYAVILQGTWQSPWRVVAVSTQLSTVYENNLVHHLATPSQLKDVSWIAPGKSSWSWWGAHDSSKDYAQLKKFVDLAATMGWEYSLVDANWNLMTTPGSTIEDLVRYANTKNVGLALWYNSGGPHNSVSEQPRDIMYDPKLRREEFAKLNAWGVKAVKVDFWQSDKQPVTAQYLDLLQDAADAHILVDLHGCTVPRGWARTYPNLMTMEAVRGAEQYG